MAAAAPPPAHFATPQAAVVTRKRRVPALSSLFGFKGCKHALKLRHTFKLDARTRLAPGLRSALPATRRTEMGLDMPIVDDHGLTHMLHASAPWAALQYQLDEADPSKGSLELNPLWVAVNRGFSLGRKGSWWEVPLDAKVGATYNGKPVVQVGIGNLPLALGLAAALLAAGKSISLERKEVGGLSVCFRNRYTLQERVEFDGALRREGRLPRLDFQQLNGVLRLRHDE